MNLAIIEQSENLTFLSLEGSLNLAGVEQIKAQFLDLTAAQNKSTIVDFSKVDFVASMGMRLLIEATKPLVREGKKLIILNPQPEVDKVLESAGMTNILEIACSEVDARALALG